MRSFWKRATGNRPHPKKQFWCFPSGIREYIETRIHEWPGPNMSVEIAARAGRLGRQPPHSRRFFEKIRTGFVRHRC